MARPDEVSKEKAVKCYYCGSMIEYSNDLVEKRFPLNTKAGIRMYRRKFHIDCLTKYIPEVENVELKKEENSSWDEVYQYFRTEILGMKETMPLDNHSVMRLRGLRLGKFYPNGENVTILPRGFSYETILLTLKVVRPKVLSYMKNANFKDGQHKTNLIMKLVVDEISDVAMRVEAQTKSVERLKEDKPKEEFDYVERLKRDRRQPDSTNSETKNHMEALFGGKI